MSKEETLRVCIGNMVFCLCRMRSVPLSLRLVPPHSHPLQVLISIGNFARGLELLKRSASLDPECPLPYVNGARAYLGMNDLVAARR